MDKIIKKIELLKFIRPEAGFVARTRAEILSATQPFSLSRLFRTSPVWAKASLAGVAALLVVLVPVFFSGTNPSLSSLENADELSAEAAGLPISIELQKVDYQNKNSEVITAAISEIRDNNVRHLNAGIIESEIETIPETKSENKSEEIDRLLESVTL